MLKLIYAIASYLKDAVNCWQLLLFTDDNLHALQHQQTKRTRFSILWWILSYNIFSGDNAVYSNLVQNYTFFEYGNFFSQNQGVPLPNFYIQTFTHYSISVFQAMLLLLVLLAGYEGMLNYYKVIRLVCKYL